MEYALGAKGREGLEPFPWDAVSHWVTGVGDSNGTTLGQDKPQKYQAVEYKFCGCQELQPHPGGDGGYRLYAQSCTRATAPWGWEMGLTALVPELEAVHKR